MKIICTLCSRKKDKKEGLLPAHKRYTSSRAKAVLELSKKKKIPLYYLSGKFGLVEADAKIPHYDLLLLPKKVDLISGQVTKQIEDKRITHVLFYVKSEFKKKHKPYYDVISKACKSSGIKLEIIKLELS